MSLCEMIAVTDEKKLESEDIDRLICAYDDECSGQSTEMREYLYFMLPSKVKREIKRRDRKLVC